MSKFLNENEELILRYVWNSGEYGVNSASTWRIVKERLPPGETVSRATVIYHLNKLVDRGVLNVKEATGKGGHRKIWYPQLDETAFVNYVLETILQSMMRDFSEETYQLIKGMVQSRTEAELRECYDELQSASKDMQRSKAERDAILEFIAQSISLKDIDFRFKWINKALADTIGLPVEEIIGKKCFEITFGRDEPCEGCLFQKAVESGEIIRGDKIFADGSLRISVIEPIVDAKGSVLAAVERAKRKDGDG